MIEEMTGTGGRGLLEEIAAAGRARPVVVVDAGYGHSTTSRTRHPRKELLDRSNVTCYGTG